MKHATLTLAFAAALCTATAAHAAEREKRKTQEIVVAEAKGETERAGRDPSVEALKAIFRKRLSTISRWSQLR